MPTLEGVSGRPVDPERLAYRVVPLDEGAARALLARAYRSGRVLEREGLCLASFGTAATLSLATSSTKAGSGVERVLAAITREPTSDAAAPLALGALPFDQDRPCALVIPEVTVIATADRPPIALVVAERGDLETRTRAHLDEAAASPAASQPPPDRFDLESVVSHATFSAQVAAAVRAIRRGELDKVVLAREVTVAANRPWQQAELLGRLRALHPSCCTFALDGFIGATPELLVRRHGRVVVSHPLAGTVARSGDPERDRRLAAALLASEKERGEHRFVVEAICRDLALSCEELRSEPVPHVLELRNVVHLATRIEATLCPGPAPSALDLACLLHPTPAVGGTPRDAALAYLKDHEPIDRDRYAGPVGYVDAEGDGEWWIGIRSAIVDGATARMFAGAGIVADSVPAEELAETQLKLQALLAVLVRP